MRNILIWGLMAHFLGAQEMHTSGHVEIQRDAKQTIRSLLCEGPTVITIKDQAKGVSHQLSSSGTLKVNHIEQQVEIDSPRDAHNTVLSGKQVHFEDALGEIFADRAIFYYSFDQGHLVPKRLELFGEVKIYNHSSGSIQYALADRAEYQFKENTLLLQSVERPRVLFYDTFNKVQASAPSLQVQRDPKTGSEAIQGHGDVHFLFAEEEWNELKKRFTLHEAA